MASLKDPKEIEAAFFRAMRVGWAFGAKGVPIEGRPGGKCIEYREGDWLVADEYYVTDFSTRSEGTKRIWFRNVLVWSMHYGGPYDERAIPILKAALRDSYSTDNFFGGRGRDPFPLNELLYENRHSGNFTRFSGLESVIYDSAQGLELGYHAYSGMLMVDLPLPDSEAEQMISAVQAELGKVDFSNFADGDDIVVDLRGKMPGGDEVCIYKDNEHTGERYFYLAPQGWEIDGHISVGTTKALIIGHICKEIEKFLRENFPDMWEL